MFILDTSANLALSGIASGDRLSSIKAQLDAATANAQSLEAQREEGSGTENDTETVEVNGQATEVSKITSRTNITEGDVNAANALVASLQEQFDQLTQDLGRTRASNQTQANTTT